MIGRLSPEKRQDVLIRAIQKSKYASRIQIYFAGCGPWEQKLQRMGKKLPISPVFGIMTDKNSSSLSEVVIYTSIRQMLRLKEFPAWKLSHAISSIISDSKQSASARFA